MSTHGWKRNAGRAWAQAAAVLPLLLATACAPVAPDAAKPGQEATAGSTASLTSDGVVRVPLAEFASVRVTNPTRALVVVTARFEITGVQVHTWEITLRPGETAILGEDEADNISVRFEYPASTDFRPVPRRFLARQDFTGGTLLDVAAPVLPIVVDCNRNGLADADDLVAGTSPDCNDNLIPDECELAGNDCDGNAVLDVCELADHDCDDNAVLDACELADNDCNDNGVLDACESGRDCNGNGVPDGCESDGDSDGVIDACDNCPAVANAGQADADADGIGDACEVLLPPPSRPPPITDCNANGIDDAIDIAKGTSTDCNDTGVPDSCELANNDCNNNGVLDDCEATILFGAQGGDEGGIIYTIDSATGAVEVFVDLMYLFPAFDLYSVTGLALSPDRRTLFASTRYDELLFAVDVRTAKPTLVGSFGTVPSEGETSGDEIVISDLVFLPDGRLIGSAPQQKALASIDTGTGQAMILCSTEPIKFAGLARSPAGVLYGTTPKNVDPPGTLFRIDPDTCDLVQIGKGTGFDSVSGLAFHPDGTLYGSTANGFDAAVSGPELITIDLATGMGRIVADVTGFGVANLDGLAFAGVPGADCNGNGVPDACELGDNDCNGNGVPDDCDLRDGTLLGFDQPDFDCDGDVDLADYLSFVACFTGPGSAAADRCYRADLDDDGDVDLADLIAFQAAFTGPR